MQDVKPVKVCKMCNRIISGGSVCNRCAAVYAIERIKQSDRVYIDLVSDYLWENINEFGMYVVMNTYNE